MSIFAQTYKQINYYSSAGHKCKSNKQTVNPRFRFKAFKKITSKVPRVAYYTYLPPIGCLTTPTAFDIFDRESSKCQKNYKIKNRGRKLVATQ